MKESKAIKFIKREPVFVAATILAILSSFLVIPDKTYLNYIDFRTLGILFSLMAVMAGFKNIGIFHRMATGLLSRTRNLRQVFLVLILLCFFLSMLITNDVALITFVPLTLVIMDLLGTEVESKWLIPIVVMQTIAANLGSMMTPLGNPQNLYLYGKAGLPVLDFLLFMLPYTGLSLLLIFIWCFLRKRSESSQLVDSAQFSKKEVFQEKKSAILYSILFLLCMLTVARIIPYPLLCGVVLAFFLIYSPKVLLNVDYILLLTFVAFFVFIGNMGRVDSFYQFLSSAVSGHEVSISIAASQIISNVPAALLLSGFTDQYQLLIVGTNLGGLGTLIASMASLISFKYVSHRDNVKTGSYLLYFSIMNLVFLAALILLAILLK